MHAASDAPRRAVVLLSGGLDSYTAAAIAKAEGFDLYALTVAYGQRHAVELEAARRVAAALGVARHVELQLDLSAFGGSSLTGSGPVPKDRPIGGAGIPSTYVPARNTVFLSLALAWAEALGAADIFIGVNAVDYSGYPDCRPEFIESFERTAALATRAGVDGARFTHPHAAHQHDERGDHPARPGARPRLRADQQLLRPGARRRAVRAMRQLRAQGARVRRGRRARPGGWSPGAPHGGREARRRQREGPLVTERLYYTDPTCIEFDATVVSVVERRRPTHRRARPHRVLPDVRRAAVRHRARSATPR